VLDYTQLTRRGQIRRLRRLAEAALARYEVGVVSVLLLKHLYNTTFAVTGSDGSRYVLRVQRTGDASLDARRRRARVESELWWLERLRTDLDLAVPEPVRTPTGEGAVSVSVEGVPEGMPCALLRRVDGRFVDRRLMPFHLAQIGRLTARLHDYSVRLSVPDGFDRQGVVQADPETEEGLVRLFTDHRSRESGRVVRSVLQKVRRAQEELGDGAESFGLIHADIHQKNYLFGNGEARLIDFDDCGWGHYLYDLAVTISEVGSLPRARSLAEALFAGYRQIRDLSPAQEGMVHSFYMLRELQNTTWFLQQRHNPQFGRVPEREQLDVRLLERLLAESE